MEKINQLITDILNHAITNIPDKNWANFTLNIYALNKMLSLQAVYEINNNFKSFDAEGSGIELTMKSKSLREEMYKQSPEKGAWFTAYFTVQSNGQFQTHFEYEEKPEFTYEPSKEKYIDDLNKFPREEGLIPQWLKDIVNS